MKARTVVVSSAVILVAAVTLLVALSSRKKIEIQYIGGEKCVEYPDPVTIYTDDPDKILDNVLKPKKVKWVVDKSLGFKWTFAYNAQKGKRSGKNLLGGPFMIAAGKKSVKSGTSKTAGNWYYDIIVDDPDGEGCRVDPEIIIDQ